MKREDPFTCADFLNAKITDTDVAGPDGHLKNNNEIEHLLKSLANIQNTMKELFDSSFKSTDDYRVMASEIENNLKKIGSKLLSNKTKTKTYKNIFWG